MLRSPPGAAFRSQGRNLPGSTDATSSCPRRLSRALRLKRAVWRCREKIAVPSGRSRRRRRLPRGRAGDRRGGSIRA